MVVRLPPCICSCNSGFRLCCRCALPQELFHDLRSGQYDDAAAAPGDMLQRLTFAADTFSAVSDRGARYRGYEELFGQQPSKGLEDVEQVGWGVGRPHGGWERGWYGMCVRQRPLEDPDAL